MNLAGDSHMISLHLNEEQVRWLENTAAFIENETGCKASHSSIMLRLMELGLPEFDREMQNLRAKANASRKRFPRLQLAYSRIE